MTAEGILHPYREPLRLEGASRGRKVPGALGAKCSRPLRFPFLTRSTRAPLILLGTCRQQGHEKWVEVKLF